MKHIQNDYKVKTYIPQETANQNVASVGERKDEDQAFPSVMKFTEKLTEQEVRKRSQRLTLTTHSALSRSWTYQLLRSPTQSWKLSQHSKGADPRTSHRTDRQHVDTRKWWRRSSKILNLPAASCERTRCEDCLKA